MRDWIFGAVSWVLLVCAVVFIAGVTAAVHPGSGINSVASLAPDGGTIDQGPAQ